MADESESKRDNMAVGSTLSASATASPGGNSDEFTRPTSDIISVRASGSGRKRRILEETEYETRVKSKAGALLCTICLRTFTHPLVTSCGHTYCDECITRHLQSSSRCPACGVFITADELRPNFTVNELLSIIHKNKTISAGPSYRNARVSRTFMLTEENEANRKNEDDAQEEPSLHAFESWADSATSLSDIDHKLALLQRQRDAMLNGSKVLRNTLTVEFLKDLKRIKVAAQKNLEQELKLIDSDLKWMNETQLPTVSSSFGKELYRWKGNEIQKASVGTGFNTQEQGTEGSTLAQKNLRIHNYFSELCDMYLSSRNAHLVEVPPEDDPDFSTSTVSTMDLNSAARLMDAANSRTHHFDSLLDFSKHLQEISVYKGLKPLATINYSQDILGPSNVASSTEFDKDGEFFSVTGTSGKIRIFEYAGVIGGMTDYHFPSSELVTTSRVSSASWNNYLKNRLVSADYEGKVMLWDTGNTALIKTFSEHQNRVWSVDWCQKDPRLFASGSDDSKIRIWDISSDRAVKVISAEANVCSVKFSSTDTYTLACGLADRHVYVYDIRNPSTPVSVLKGHQRTVSHVKFIGQHELVSASTDNHLKLWDLRDFSLIRTYEGHSNNKHFVGLATDGNFMACGSEDNSLYVYSKYLSKPLFSFKFQAHTSMFGAPRTDMTNNFVSAVSWRKDSPVIVGANSQGAIKVLQLV